MKANLAFQQNPRNISVIEKVQERFQMGFRFCWATVYSHASNEPSQRTQIIKLYAELATEALRKGVISKTSKTPEKIKLTIWRK